MLISDTAGLDLLPPRQPAVSHRDFTDTMARMATTVCLVTASFDGESSGRTATAVLSLSATPPSVLVSIDIATPLADIIVRARGFSLAMLSQDQQMIADAFAGKLGTIDRFLMGVWGTWPSGHPHLYGAATAFDCELIGTIDAGTHMLFAGAIVHTDLSNIAEPLIWHERRYRALAK
jgi:flavin reductase (DIM6/NTAB) family NADH-FMN oxidoreductase RutF